MKNIITATTCRTRNFSKYLFADILKLNKHCFRVDRTDTLSNPLFMKTIYDNIKSVSSLEHVFYDDLQFQHPPNIRGNYQHAVEMDLLLKKYRVHKIDCIAPDKYDLGVFEVSSTKYEKSNKDCLSQQDFENHIRSIEAMCNFPVLWISSHNVRFTREHKNQLGIPQNKFTENNTLVSRTLVDKYLQAIIPSDRLILPSKVFSKHTSQHIFTGGEDITGSWSGQEGGGGTHHYNPLGQELIGEEISAYIRKIIK